MDQPTTSKELTEEQKEMVLVMAKDNIHRVLKQTKSRIDKLSSRGAIRVLKYIGQVHGAESLLKGSDKESTLKDNEKELIEWIFELQQNVMGYIQLQNETKGESNESKPE